MAYFLNNFLPKSTNDVTIKNLSNLKYNKSEIQNVINNNVFSLNKDGNFNEFEAINTVILLASLRKTLKLEPSDKNYPELNQYKGSWFYNDLVIAFDNNLFSKSELSFIKQKLTNANFVKIASRLQQMQSAIASRTPI